MVLVLIASCQRETAPPQPQPAAPPTDTAPPSQTQNAAPPAVELSASQLHAIKLEPAKMHRFSDEKEAVGTIDFDNSIYSDPNLSTPVFPPSSGEIVKIFVDLGERVRKGQPLYSLTGSAGSVVVSSPMAGQVSSVNAAPGLSVQPGVQPAPVTVARVTGKWVLANVIESDSPLYRVGESVEVHVTARPEQAFKGRVSKVYPNVDPTNHRITVRAEITDPQDELLSGMLATFTVQVGAPIETIGVPADAVVREGDGTMTVWISPDGHHFSPRAVRVGLRNEGQVQLLDGVREGELVVTEGAVFLSNMLQGTQPD